MKDKLLKIREVADLLRVDITTLRRWDKNGKLPPIKTIGGHRMYYSSQIESILGRRIEEENG